LIVNNPVEDGSNYASDCDFEGFHRELGLDWIVTVVISPLHSSWPCAGHLSVMAFHEKAGRSQVDSFFIS
jgi:hypothetical protein